MVIEISNFEQEVTEILADKGEILLGYVFGSYVKGREHDESDIDIGILVEGSMSNNELFELCERLESVLNIEVDVRVLNGEDPRFVYNVLREGEILYMRDEEVRISFETSAMREYLDMKPFIDRYDRAVRQRLTG